MRQIVRPMRWLVVVVGFLLALLVPDRSFAASNPASVVILMSDAAGAAAPLRTALLSQGIPVVNIDARPGGPAPALSALEPYDVVVVWTNFALGQGSAGWGDVLADYVDGGGHLLLATFSWWGPSFDIDGRIATPGYSPFDSGNVFLSGSQLGAHDPLHAIMAGVSSVSAFYNNVQIDPGAILVASWAAACRLSGSMRPARSWASTPIRVRIGPAI